MTRELHEKFKKFEEKVGADWRKRFEEITTTDALMELGSEYGITLSEVQAQEGLKFLKTEAQELSEKELSAIAGGIGSATDVTSIPRRKMDP
ncbi:MAG TPA: bacteriocin [Thermotogota bacterium]|nr:bacteriocin [Thermotogota bacterium]